MNQRIWKWIERHPWFGGHRAPLQLILAVLAVKPGNFARGLALNRALF